MNNLLLALVIVFCFVFTQSSSAHDFDKLIQSYKDFYIDELGIGLIKSEAETKDLNLRRKLLKYIRENKLGASSSELETKWQSMLKTKFKSPLELAELAKNNYHSVDSVKAKFIQDLDLLSYFNKKLSQDLNADLEFRAGLIKDTKLSDKDKLEAQRQLSTNLNNSNLGSDFDFLIDSNLRIRDSLANISNKKLENRINNLMLNSSFNHDEARDLILSQYKNQIKYLSQD